LKIEEFFNVPKCDGRHKKKPIHSSFPSDYKVSDKQNFKILNVIDSFNSKIITKII